MVHLSGAEWVFAGVVAVVGSVIGYLLSENDRRTLGRTPWGLPSLVWGLFWFLSFLLGLVLFLIAHVSEVRRAEQASSTAFPGATRGPVTGAPIARPMSVAEQFPAYPRPANLSPARTDPERSSNADGAGSSTEPSTAPTPEQLPAATWTNSPPAWHPDPSGRFHYRWWDGHQWTSQVSIDGQLVVDTSPDQRIGPYH